MTNRKLRMRFRLVSKSTTLDDLERPFHTLFQNTCVLGAHHENLNEDRPITISGKDVAQSAVTASDCIVSVNKVYADIRGGSLETRCQTTMG